MLSYSSHCIFVGLDSLTMSANIALAFVYGYGIELVELLNNPVGMTDDIIQITRGY